MTFKKGGIYINYIMNKLQYLKMQEKLYDEIDNILKKNQIHNIVYKVVDKGIFFTPNYNEIRERKYTSNINQWLSEIYWTRNNVFEEILFCMAYHETYLKYDFEGICKGNIHLYAERYLKLSIYDLFSIREKIAYLIYETFNRQIKVKNKKIERISFKKIISGLNQLDVIAEKINWISTEEFIIIKDILNNNFNNEICDKIFNEIRHPFTHRSNPGIDYMSLESFEFKEVDEDTRQMLLKFDKDLGGENPEKYKYIIKSAKMLEGKYKFDDVINDILDVWTSYVNGLKILLTEINIIKNEIEKIEVM